MNKMGKFKLYPSRMTTQQEWKNAPRSYQFVNGGLKFLFQSAARRDKQAVKREDSVTCHSHNRCHKKLKSHFPFSRPNFTASSTTDAYWSFRAAARTRDGLVVASVGLYLSIAKNEQHTGTKNRNYYHFHVLNLDSDGKKGSLHNKNGKSIIAMFHHAPSKSPVSATTTVYFFS